MAFLVLRFIRVPTCYQHLYLLKTAVQCHEVDNVFEGKWRLIILLVFIIFEYLL